MALTVNYNSASGNAMNNVSRTQRNLAKSFARISSGLRITSAADDAAGLAVSENMDADTRSLRQAARNTNDGISVIQTVEGATEEVTDMLKRMRELAVQSRSETLDATSRGYADEEYKALLGEINRISDVTEFNGIALGNADKTLNVQVGIGSSSTNDVIGISLEDFDATALALPSGYQQHHECRYCAGQTRHGHRLCKQSSVRIRCRPKSPGIRTQQSRDLYRKPILFGLSHPRCGLCL